MTLVGVMKAGQKGYYVMDSGRRIRFYPWIKGKPSAPLSRQRVVEELQNGGVVLDETFSAWADLQARVKSLLGPELHS